MMMIEGESGNLVSALDTSRRYTIQEIKTMLEKAAEKSPHLKADFGLISREEAYLLDPADPLRIVDYLDILKL
jgi:hypothetical protein